MLTPGHPNPGGIMHDQDRMTWGDVDTARRNRRIIKWLVSALVLLYALAIARNLLLGLITIGVIEFVELAHAYLDVTEWRAHREVHMVASEGQSQESAVDAPKED